jgi:hypothetical protein
MTCEALMIKGVIVTEASAEVLDGFTDKEGIVNYAIESVATLVQENLIMGSDNKINSKNNMTRAEAAVLMNRLIKIGFNMYNYYILIPIYFLLIQLLH